MLRVNRLAAAIDMIAAGTSAPIAMAENAMPANQLGNCCSKNAGTASCAFGLPSAPITEVFAAIAAKPSRARKPEHQRVERQHGGVAADGVAAAAGQHAGHGVRVHEQRQRRAQRQRRVRERRLLTRDERTGGLVGLRADRTELHVGGVEDLARSRTWSPRSTIATMMTM